MSVCLHVDPSAQIKIQSNKENNKIALVEALLQSLWLTLDRYLAPGFNMMSKPWKSWWQLLGRFLQCIREIYLPLLALVQ